MVYAGRSFACTTCKKRRIKCDQTRPFCKNCAKRKVPCPGVRNPEVIRFKDETLEVIRLFQGARHEESSGRDSDEQSDAVLPNLAEDENFTSLCFFHRNFMMSGRGIQSSQGLFQHLIPYYQLTDSDSLVSVATASLAATMLSMSRGREPDSTLSRMYNGRAITLLKDALGTSEGTNSDTTLIAIIALQFRAALIAHRKMVRVDGSHQRGAYAVVHHRTSKGFRTMASKRLLQEVRNTMISEAIRTRQPVHVDPAVWHDEGPMPVSPASDLDAIAIDLANLQALYEQYKNTWRIGFANGQTVLTAKDLSVIASFRRTATAIDQRLQIWADSQAPHFSPLRMAMIEVPESVRKAGMYGNFCNVYPSAQLAGIWHAYNSYRLILLKMTLSADQTVREMHRENDVFFAESDKWRETAEETLQHCVDEICAVVPFHLGNRTGTGSILEFSDTTNLEYPWPKPENDPYSSPSTPTARDYARRHNVVPLSSDERKRQNIAMGGYNILGPIAFVLGLAEEPLDLTGLRSTAPKLGSLLRPDQIPWLAGQLQRTLKLHRTRRLDGDARKVSTPVQRRSSEQESKDGNLMKKVAAVKKTMEYSFGV